jgi:hypothetical protein
MKKFSPTLSLVIITLWLTTSVMAEKNRALELTKNTPCYLHQDEAGYPQIMENSVSVPGDFPFVEVYVNDNPAPGRIFLNNYGGPPYMMILENSGAPYWYNKTADRQRDFKVQPNGLLTYRHIPTGSFQGMDSTYTVVKTFKAGKGWHVDEHELQVLENNHYLIIAIKDSSVDMSQIVAGGKKNANVNISALQEFDADGKLLLHWSAWKYFHPKDMVGYSYDDQPTDNSFRFVHMNSVDIDDDDNIVLSSKRISEITKINRNTGEIIWRLGGANNQFTFVDDPLNGFYTQHDIRALGNNHYTLFDNGNLHNPPLSRAVEYEIDTEAMTATLVWEYQEGTFGFHMGNVQRLPDGHTVINWAVENLPKLTEVRPDGSKAYEMNFVDRYKSYRVFRFQWDVPAIRPYLVVESHTDGVALIFNQFGDSQVDHYRIYAGTSPHPTTLHTISDETLTWLTDLENDTQYYFRVTSVNRDGLESAYSNEESAIVQVIPTGMNQVINGDFSDNEAHWSLDFNHGAQAGVSWNGLYHLTISNPGQDYSDIQLVQNNIKLIQGKPYLFEFTINASKTMAYEAKIEQTGSPFTNYSKTGFSVATQREIHVQHKFVMDDPSDLSASIVFNFGDNTGEFYLDDISLKSTESSGADSHSRGPDVITLGDAFPNPFNSQTRIPYHIDRTAEIEISLWNIRGEKVTNLVKKREEPGKHQINLNAENLYTGIYLIRLVSRSNGDRICESRKLMLIK